MASAGARRTVPRSGLRSPARTRSSVLLPTPFGPTRPMRWPASTAMSTSSRMMRVPSDCLMSRASRDAGTRDLRIERDGSGLPQPAMSTSLPDDPAPRRPGSLLRLPQHPRPVRRWTGRGAGPWGVLGVIDVRATPIGSRFSEFPFVTSEGIDPPPGRAYNGTHVHHHRRLDPPHRRRLGHRSTRRPRARLGPEQPHVERPDRRAHRRGPAGRDRSTSVATAAPTARPAATTSTRWRPTSSPCSTSSTCATSPSSGSRWAVRSSPTRSAGSARRAWPASC